jgi:hypothetical protein
VAEKEALIAELQARVQALEARLASLTGEGEPRVLQAGGLVLRDDAGRVRALLGVDSHGAVSLRLIDLEGTVRAQVCASADGGSVLLANEAGELRAGLYAAFGADDVTALELRGADGKPRVVLAAPEQRDPIIALCDAQGHAASGLTVKGSYGPATGTTTARGADSVPLPDDLESQLEDILLGEPDDLKGPAPEPGA